MYPKLSFAGITNIIYWAANTANQVRFVGNDNDLPFVCKDQEYYYFAFDGKKYNLVMVSSRDLNVKN